MDIKDIYGKVIYSSDAKNFRELIERAALIGANLSGADLSGERLSGADLSWARLSGARLTRADLSWARLSGADLYGANLSGARLSGADLVRAVSYRRICPEVGSFTAWKSLRGGLIAQLEIPAQSKRVGGLIGRKCRAESAKVIAIWAGKKKVREGFSRHDGSFKYVTGKIVRPLQKYNDDARVECASGIHFFMSRLEAEEYN